MGPVPTAAAAQQAKAGTAPAIVVDRVTKQYRRYAHAHRFLTLKSAVLKGNLFAVLAPDEIFTALDEVSLSVGRGETFGVIGNNGAGKSTLLKIVAGTTKPTTGRVEVNGKVSALIELGAGFHPEISGRENVFINGIMLGLTRQQIRERFDDIVGFAELEEFIDAPVKTYSSGMYMRLGFSVAIHVEPDILLIDEVLAVGDAAFVHKCLDKIGEFRRRGKTILLVTHGMDTVRQLCDRALWLHAGRVEMLGDPHRVVDAYLSWVARKEEDQLAADHRRSQAAAGPGTEEAAASGAEAVAGEGPPPDAPYEPGRWGNRQVVIEEVRLLDRRGAQRYVFGCGEPMTIELRVRAREPVEDFVFGIGVFNANGVCCYGTNTDIEGYEPGRLEGEATVRVAVEALNLVQGTYYLDVATHRRDGTPYDYQRGLVRFRTTSTVADVGVSRLPHRWEFAGRVSWARAGGVPGPGAEPEATPGAGTAPPDEGGGG